MIICSMIILTLVSCKHIEKEECMIKALNFAELFDYYLYMNKDGHWYQGNFYSKARSLVSPRSDSFIDFYTEVRFVHSTEEVFRLPTNVIAVRPNPEIVQGIINAMYLDILSEGNDLENTLSRFGLIYPISKENLVEDWEKVRALLTRSEDSGRMFDVIQFARTYNNQGSPLTYALFILFSSSFEEQVLSIINKLGITEDEGAILLRQLGSYDAFVFITTLMLEEGLSFERARRRYERETSSSNVIDYGSLHAQQIIRIDTMLFNS